MWQGMCSAPGGLEMLLAALSCTAIAAMPPLASHATMGA